VHSADLKDDDLAEAVRVSLDAVATRTCRICVGDRAAVNRQLQLAIERYLASLRVSNADAGGA
jgi:hypothetical protein